MLDGYGIHTLIWDSADERLGDLLVASPADATGRGIELHVRQGDQTGRESNFRTYYDYPWDGRLEWVDRGDTDGGSPVVVGEIDKLANDVINGVFGNGDARRAALGDKYDAVQARVNEILGGGGVDIDDLARRVIDGEFGNGQERQDRLGANYAAVQARVNEMLR